MPVLHHAREWATNSMDSWRSKIGRRSRRPKIEGARIVRELFFQLLKAWIVTQRPQVGLTPQFREHLV